MSPTQLSLKWLREKGYEAVKVEHWNPFAKRRVDLWGADILARRGTDPLLAVQTTTRGNLNARVKKTMQERGRWIDSGNYFVCHGWRKAKRKTPGTFHGYVLTAK